MKILVVDDDSGILNALKAGMCSLGFEVVTMTKAMEALETIAGSCETTHPFDCLITDLKMPEMNGLDLIRMAKEYMPELTCILMTAHCNDDLLKEPTSCTFCDLIEKPFTPDMLIDRINLLKR